VRRLPVYFLLDVSDSMVGEPRRMLEEGIRKIVQRLRTDPHALETAYVAVIAFAGNARKIVGLTDLLSFNAPALPVGSGTSLGLALEELMDAIKQEIVPTTRERKGDWKPLVYILTDGKPTDSYDSAFARWSRDFTGKAHVMGVGLGEYAATDVLDRVCEQVFVYNGESENEFDGLVRWITNSIASVSEAPGKVDLSKATSIPLDDDGLALAPAGTTVRQDQDCVVLVGRCQKSRQPFLVKYDRKQNGGDAFEFVGSHAVDESYFEWSAQLEGSAPSVRSDQLEGPFMCPHCGTDYGARCSCGNNLCIDKSQSEVVCPWCRSTGRYSREGGGGGIEVSRSSG